MSKKVVYACNPSPVYVDGHVVVMGQHWLADDPIVRAHPHLFSSDARYGLAASGPLPEEPVVTEPPVEEATAAPGTKRAR